MPDSFSLQANPNPFNPGCNITFRLAQPNNIKISLYDISGKYIQFIYNGILKAGDHNIYWQPNNIASGTYFIRIFDGEFSQNVKVVCLK